MPPTNLLDRLKDLIGQHDAGQTGPLPSNSPGARVEEMHPRAGDLLAQVSVQMYKEAYSRGMSLSAYLNCIPDPHADQYRDGQDMFSRILQVARVRTYSNPVLGMWADTMADFAKDEQTNALIPEWASRVWRYVTATQPAVRPAEMGSRAFYTSSDFIPGSVMNPFFDSQRPVVTQIVPPIPMDQVVAIQQGIDRDTYRSFYLTDDTNAERLVRVAQGAEVPRVSLTGGDHEVKLRKFGRAIEMTYEQMRRMRIDMMALHLAQLAAQTEADKVTAAIGVLVAGDGNTGTAATNYNLTTLDTSATAPDVTLTAWLAYKMKFKPPFALTTVLVSDTVALQLFLLSTGNANIPLVAINGAQGFGGFTAINPTLRDAVAIGWTSDAPSGKVVGFDRRQALIYLTETGADIQEVERWATRQVQTLVMTEVDGFATLNPNAVKTMDTLN
jgi:hypothetical protein